MRFHLNFKWEDRRKDLRLFDLIIPLRVGRPFQGEHKETHTPSPCESRLSAAVWSAEEYLLLFAPVTPRCSSGVLILANRRWNTLINFTWQRYSERKFQHHHQFSEAEPVSSVRYWLPHWIVPTFADGSKTKSDVRFISTHKLPTIRG